MAVKSKRKMIRVKFIRKINLIFLTLLLFSFLGIFDENAYAYLDPGTGSYFFQLFIATLIGVIFAIKLSWRKIVFFLKNLFPPKRKNG